MPQRVVCDLFVSYSRTQIWLISLKQKIFSCKTCMVIHYIHRSLLYSKLIEWCSVYCWLLLNQSFTNYLITTSLSKKRGLSIGIKSFLAIVVILGITSSKCIFINLSQFLFTSLGNFIRFVLSCNAFFQIIYLLVMVITDYHNRKTVTCWRTQLYTRRDYVNWENVILMEHTLIASSSREWRSVTAKRGIYLTSVLVNVSGRDIIRKMLVDAWNVILNRQSLLVFNSSNEMNFWNHLTFTRTEIYDLRSFKARETWCAGKYIRWILPKYL